MQMTKISYYGPETCSVEDFLKKDLGLSGQWLKKHDLTKNFLKKDLRPHEELTLPLDLLNKDLISPVYRGEEVTILFENERFLVVEKPCSTHGHPLRYSDQTNLLSFLRAKKKFEVPSLSIGGQEKGWLYRLDFETSGVLVGCKNTDDYNFLRSSFETSVLRKRYLCVVNGTGPEDGQYQFSYTATGQMGSKMRAEQFREDRGTLGTSWVKKVFESRGRSVYRVDLVTGIRHQIRATFEALGFPLLGDELYGGEKADRLYLHAYEYHLKCQNEESFKFQSLPLSFGNDLLDLNSLLQVLHDQSLISES